MKERFTIPSSSLGDYFGVGFNTVLERFNYDLGIEEQVFDDDSQDRMDLGNAMEDGCMNYFEKKMGIEIDERNTEIVDILDGKLRCKRDGRTFLDGVETGWENKYSNGATCFTESVGYYLQCQAYMLAFGLNQWVLAGMWQGKPVFKIIKRDDEIIDDIIAIVESAHSILIGLEDIDDYRWDIVEKYSKQKELKQLNELDLENYDKELLLELGQLKTQKSFIDKKIDELVEYVKSTFDDSTYSDGEYKYTVSTSEGRMSFDKDTLSIEHPELDLSKYYKKGEPIKTVRCSKLKKKEGN